jgi:hypothetical protein
VLRVALENRSTTLQPELVVYDVAKAQIGSARNTTAGGDVSYSFGPAKAAITACAITIRCGRRLHADRHLGPASDG